VLTESDATGVERPRKRAAIRLRVAPPRTSKRAELRPGAVLAQCNKCVATTGAVGSGDFASKARFLYLNI
jgi:hypothetical protein